MQRASEEQIAELRYIRILLQEAREHARNVEGEHLEAHLGGALRKIDERMDVLGYSSHQSPALHPPFKSRSKQEGTEAFSPLSVIPWQALVATLAGLAWMAAGITDVVSAGGQDPEVFGFAPLDEALYAIALVGTLGGLVGLHARQAPSYGRLGAVGFLAAFVGCSLLLIGLILDFLVKGGVFGESALLDEVLGLGLLGTLVGYVLLGAATLRLGALARGCGLLLIVCLPLAVALGDYGGAIVLGVVWLALGYVLLSQRDLSALLQTTDKLQRVSKNH